MCVCYTPHNAIALELSRVHLWTSVMCVRTVLSDSRLCVFVCVFLTIKKTDIILEFTPRACTSQSCFEGLSFALDS